MTAVPIRRVEKWLWATACAASGAMVLMAVLAPPSREGAIEMLVLATVALVVLWAINRST